MKKILFLSLIILSKVLAAQSYIPLPMDSVVWRCDFNGHDFQMGCYCTLFYQYYPNGDTLINSTNYTKIYKSGGEQCPDPCYYWIYNGYKGAVRQDTLLKKVFLIVPNSTSEKTLYDFSQNLGDTVNSILIGNCEPSIITNIDSVLINSNYHKRFQIGQNNCNPMGGYFIEGIGSTQGFLDTLYSFEFGSVLVCVKHFNQTIFENYYSYSDCVIAVESVLEITRNEITISPNPTNDKINIENLSIENDEKISIYNLQGQLLLQQSTTDAKTELDISAFAKGMYFIKVDTDRGVVSKKIIKE